MKPTHAEFLQALAKIEKLSSAPMVLARAMSLVNNPNAHARELMTVIGTDAALVADVLRLANSAARAPGNPIGALDEAITRLGFREVYRLLCLSLSRGIFCTPLAAYGLDAAEFWASSVRAAVLMESLAPWTSLDPSRAYTTGLLHGVGRLAINQVLQDFGYTSVHDPAVPTEHWERDTVGIDHGEAGSLLLQRWGFPNDMAQALVDQRAPQRPPNPSPLSRALRDCVILLEAAGPDLRLPKDSLLFVQGLPESKDIPMDLPLVLDQAREAFGAIRQLMKMPARGVLR